MAKLSAIIKVKKEERALADAAKAKKLAEERDVEAQKLLEIVRKALPTALSVDYDHEGGLTEMGCMHYFYGSRLDLGEEFDLHYSLGVSIRLPFVPEQDSEGELDFDNSISLEYVADQIADSGSTKVSFEMDGETICNMYFGDFEVIPTTEADFKAMFKELLAHICPDIVTRDVVYEDVENALDDSNVKFKT